MKTLYYSIIAGTSITVAGIILIMFVMNPIPHANITIEGLQDKYNIGTKLDFFVIAKGYGSSCNGPTVDISDATNQSQIIWSGSYMDYTGMYCNPHDFEYTFHVGETTPYSIFMKVPIILDKPGTYVVKAHLLAYSITSDSEQEFSVTPFTTVNLIPSDELDRIHSFCNDPVVSTNGSDILVTCPMPANVTSWIDISPPVYKQTVCHSTYGCSGKYVYIQQNKDAMISEKQKEELENFVLKDMPEAKSWPAGWNLDNVEIQVRPNSVIAYMQFFIPVINPTYKNCGWYPHVNVDLERKDIVARYNLIPQSNVTCTK